MIFITLLAGFVPLLQVTFIVVGRITTGLLAVKDRDKINRITWLDPYYVVSDYWVDHSEIDLLIVHLTSSWQIGEICWSLCFCLGFRSAKVRPAAGYRRVLGD